MTHVKTFLALAALLALSACNSYKPPPGWPDGPERPINSKQPAAKPADAASTPKAEEKPVSKEF